MKQEVLTDILDKIIDYRGKTPKKLGGDWSGSGYRALSALQVKTTGLQNLDECHYVDENIYRKWMKEEVKRGDILMTSEAPAGQVFYWDSDEKIVLSQRLFCLRVNNKHNPIYVKYYLQSDTGQKAIFGNLSGSTVSGVSAKTLEYTTIFTRSLGEETKIANVLYSIDKKIDVNSKIIETSEKLMREIYDYWFVQFDFPDENGRPYKSSGGEMVYDEILKREIPKGWKVQNLLKNDLCKDIKPGIEKFEDTKTYYATADVTDVEMGIGAQINYDNRESRANMQPKPNSVWFAKMKNSIKHITVMPTSSDLLEKSIFSTGFFGLKCESETLPYIRNFIYSDYFEKVKDLNSNGATMEAISNDGVRNVKLIIPDSATLKKYSDVTSACLSQNDTLRKENTKLTSLRDWLLPMLMNGQAIIKE